MDTSRREIDTTERLLRPAESEPLESASLDPALPFTRQCPDFHTLTAYLEGRLTGGDRNALVAHLIECDRCYFAFVESARDDARDEKPAPSFAPLFITAASDLFWPMRGGIIVRQIAAFSFKVLRLFCSFPL